MSPKERFDRAIRIQPSFPNWEKSFVSGPKSTLYTLEHRFLEEPVSLITHARFKTHAEGPPGHVHGGATAGLIDEVMGILIWNQSMPCVTQELNLYYRKALPLTLSSWILTEITLISEKTVEIQSRIQDESGKSYVEATGIFHRLTSSQLERFQKNKP